MRHSRRKFLQGCCAGIAAMGGSRVSNLVFAQTPGQRDILISVFLRGGMDALSFLPPHGDADYHAARANLALDTAQVLDLNGLHGLHPAAAPLKEIVDAGHGAIVMACGSPNPSRSHFEAQDYMDRGNPDDVYYDGGGWLARHLETFPNGSIFQGVSRGSSISVQLEGLPSALALNGADGFTLRGTGSQADDLRRALRGMYAADPDLSVVAQRTLDATDVVDRANPGDYTPGNGAVYPDTDAADSFLSIAQMIRMDLGLQAATIDFGGWDTHESQANGGNPTTGTFAGLVDQLCGALRAFWTDMTDFHGRLTVVVMSEFGRRLKENNNRGTDHGHGGVMMVLSSNLTRGGLFGSWPGLAYEQLFERVDLAITTDFRTVLGEVMIARLGHNFASVQQIFPNYALTVPLGLFGLTPPPGSQNIKRHLLGLEGLTPGMDMNLDRAVDSGDLVLGVKSGL